MKKIHFSEKTIEKRKEVRRVNMLLRRYFRKNPIISVPYVYQKAKIDKSEMSLWLSDKKDFGMLRLEKIMNIIKEAGFRRFNKTVTQGYRQTAREFREEMSRQELISRRRSGTQKTNKNILGGELF